MCIRDRGGTVYTVEGNSGDACQENSYPVGDARIYGYGVPMYSWYGDKIQHPVESETPGVG